MINAILRKSSDRRAKERVIPEHIRPPRLVGLLLVKRLDNLVNFIPWLLEVAISKACILLQRTFVPLLTENDNHNYKTVYLLLGVASPASSPHVAKEQDFKADGVGRSGAVQAHLAGTIVLCSGRI